jgi:transcriptional regulator with GAF, ATPase, and Fis domain
MKDLVEMSSRFLVNDVPVKLTEEAFEQTCDIQSFNRLFSETFQVSSCISLALQFSQEEIYHLCFYSRKPDAYNSDQINLLKRLSMSLTIDRGLISPLTNQRTQNLPAKIEHAKSSERSAKTPGFEGIIGRSHLLLNVFDHITSVAGSDTSVLILGESGTGKELIADCIHNLSPRKNRPLVKVNCATLPSTLIESDLFGHEKGSFTGALDKRIGKFEKADKGTIFLDEIGEMPLDLQVKLLRVLQEKYIERIGSRDPTYVDVRIIAATNRNLEKEVAEGRFRLDLYYRLNVFPIELPSLRERPDDIPLLIQHFLSVYNQKSGKRISGVSDKVLKKLMDYSWPGNIRQLEHFIERGVLLAKGPIIEDIVLPTDSQESRMIIVKSSAMKTIHENERDYIIQVLKKCNGRIWGDGGAAAVLNVPPTTLRSKMKKLGILRGNIE